MFDVAYELVPFNATHVQGFSDFVFRWHLETGKRGRLLQYGAPAASTGDYYGYCYATCNVAAKLRLVLSLLYVNIIITVAVPCVLEDTAVIRVQANTANTRFLLTSKNTFAIIIFMLLSVVYLNFK